MLCGAAWAQNPNAIKAIKLNTGLTCALTVAVSGDVLVVGGGVTGTWTGISDSLGSTWTQQDVFTSTTQVSLWTATANGSGADTVTLTTSGGTAPGNWCMEIDKNYYSTTLDGTPVHANTAGTPATVTTSSITTTVNGSLLLGYFEGFSSAGIISPNATTEGFVGSVNGAANHSGVYRFAGTNGAYTTTVASTTNSAVNYTQIALKPASPTTINIIDTALPTASTSNSYSYPMRGLAGTGTYTWSISSGALPTGLSISSAGVITGTPTGGTTTPTFQVTDGTHTTTKAIQLTVNSSAATPAFVQNSQTNVFGSNVGSGNVITVAINLSSGSSATNWAIPTDSLGTVYTFCGTVGAATQGVFTRLYIGTAPSGGADTLTLGSTSKVNLSEWSGAQGFCDNFIGNAGTGASNATITSGNIVTTAPNSMAAAVATSVTGTTTQGVSAPFNSTGASPYIGAYLVESSVSTYNPSFTQSGNTNGGWNIAGWSLRPSTSGAVNANHRRAWVIDRQ